jgi:hypothetical protein
MPVVGQDSPAETIEKLRMREEVEHDVRAELEPPIMRERLEELDRAKMAWLISRSVFLLVAVPVACVVVGLSFGLGVRLFFWSAFR